MRTLLFETVMILGLACVLLLGYRGKVGAETTQEEQKTEQKAEEGEEPEIKVEVTPNKVEVKVPKKPTPEAKPQPKPPEYPRTYQEAREIAKQHKKHMLIYFCGEAWCPPCQMMKKYTFPNPQIKQVLEQYVFYKIDDRGPDKAQFKRWKVSSVPTYVVATHDEKLVRSGSGYRSPENFVIWLRGPQKNTTPRGTKRVYEVRPADSMGMKTVGPLGCGYSN